LVHNSAILEWPPVSQLLGQRRRRNKDRPRGHWGRYLPTACQYQEQVRSHEFLPNEPEYPSWLANCGHQHRDWAPGSESCAVSVWRHAPPLDGFRRIRRSPTPTGPLLAAGCASVAGPGPPRSPDRLRNGLASLAYSARFRISHDVGRLQIVCGPQRHLGRLPGTWGHHRLPPLADTSWAALQRRDQEPGPTPLIGLRAGCNGLIALLLGLLAV
jgi:hypothetical protein